MIAIEEAARIILDRTALQPAEEVPLLQALGRVVTEDIHAPRDIPPASNSAMDGYAFASGSLQNNRLKVSGFLPAGDMATGPIMAGEAVRIMTGAPIPPDCDTVVPLEDVQVRDGMIEITGNVKAGSHIRLQGEELRAGDLAVKASSLLRPQEIGMLASFGRTSVPVYRRPRIAILATGDELLEPGEPFHPARLYNCNSYSIACQVMAAGAEPVLLGISGDRPDATRERMLAGIGYDALITSGGVSTGDRDYVKETITELGGEILFWKVHMKPGKPFAFAMLHGRPLFALPGNPVAAMVVFEMFVRPALLKQAGHSGIHRPSVQAVLTGPLGNRGDRPHFVSVQVRLSRGIYQITPTGDQGSARLSALIAGNGLVRLEPGAALAAGDTATALLINREFESGVADAAD